MNNDGAHSGKSLEWLEKSFAEFDTFGRIECPVCRSRNLTILDILCPNCGTMIAKNRAPIDKDGTAKLAGGLTAGELMIRAKKWWNHVGRQYFRRVRSRRGDSISLTPELRQRGILMGKKFDDLNRQEKFAICKAYHLSWFEKETPPDDVAPIVI